MLNMSLVRHSVTMSHSGKYVKVNENLSDLHLTLLPITWRQQQVFDFTKKTFALS